MRAIVILSSVLLTAGLMAPPHAPGEDLKLGAHAPIALSKTEDVRNIIVPGTTPIVSNQPVNDDITSNRGFHILQAEPLP